MAGNHGSDINPTTVKSGQSGPSPREYVRHRRHDKDARRRYDNQYTAFLAAQATRLSSTAAVIEDKLDKYGADRVKAATSLSQLP